MEVGVLGLGFVGLTTALGFSHYGHSVYAYDVDPDKMRSLEKDEIPFQEPHLQNILKEQKSNGQFNLAQLSELTENSELIFFCVGTPASQNGEPDLSSLKKAVDSVVSKMQKQTYKVLVIKSTVPPGTSLRQVRRWIQQKGLEVGTRVGLANNPEFLREGHAWDDFVHPDRIVIGEFDENSGNMVERIYSNFTQKDDTGPHIHRVSLNTAEYVKYLSNSLLATLISYSNEMAMLADEIGNIEVGKSFKILSEDKRFHGTPANITSYIYPGCSFGGYCLPKDTKAIYMSAKIDYGFSMPLLKNVIKTNERVRQFVVNKIKCLSDKKDTLGILGLAFKPGTDDVRESPAYYIIKGLIENGYNKITAYDPVAIEKFRRSYPELQVTYYHSLDKLASKSDILVLLTAWPKFKTTEIENYNKKMIDGRYFLNGSLIVAD